MVKNSENPIISMRYHGIGLEKDGQVWTEEDRQILRNGFHTGDTVTDLALRLHRSENAITQQFYAEGLVTCGTTRRRRRRDCIRKGCKCQNCEHFKTCPYSPNNRKETEYA